ncbi:MAG TPA: ATP-binding protein [Vicinamibacteria bacterium]|nr:ATP-binding protein [Vicinamibacteria bacterium]
MEGARIPAAYRHCTLGNFAPRTPALGAALDRALAYCHRFAEEGRGRGLGLLFWGGEGAGKTHLAVAVLAELTANHGLRGRFWEFPALLSEIARSYDRSGPRAETTALESALRTDLLVLDDLGSRRMTDWAADTLFAVVNARYLERRPTLITTTFEDAPPEVAARADARRRREFLVERVGRRLRSRLLEMCVFVPMQTAQEREAQRRPPRPTTLGALRRSERGPT